MHPGDEIRHRRQEMGLTMSDLSAASGVSRGMVADVENGKKSPTLRTLYLLAKGLECSVSELLGVAAPARMSVLRAADQQVYVDPASGVERRLLSPALVARGMQLLMFRIPPGAVLGEYPPDSPTVLKHVTVVRGRIVVRVGEEEYELAAGDSLSWVSDVAHAGWNPGDEWAEVLHMMSYGSQGGLRSASGAGSAASAHEGSPGAEAGVGSRTLGPA